MKIDKNRDNHLRVKFSDALNVLSKSHLFDGKKEAAKYIVYHVIQNNITAYEKGYFGGMYIRSKDNLDVYFDIQKAEFYIKDLNKLIEDF